MVGAVSVAWVWAVLVVGVCGGGGGEVVRIPLTYVFDWDMITKLPVRVAFNHSSVYSTSPTEHLHMLNYNLSVSIASFPTHQDGDVVEIGLQYPSDFIAAIAASFKVEYSAVELGKEEYLSVILFDENYVQSRDIFVNGDSYRVHVKYNFGDDYKIQGKPCQLTDGSEVFFEEYLIREALNRMSKQNQLNFRFYQDNHSIVLTGHLGNLPKLTLVRGDYIFKLALPTSVLRYLPAIKNLQRVTYVGYKALYEFDKLKFSENDIIFKRTSQVFQLYLFLLYFLVLSLFLLFISRRNLFDAGLFVKQVLKWAFLKDRLARIEVLKSELE